MPMEDALALIAKAFQNIFGERGQQERTEISHKAADLADDYLERELYESYHVPLGIKHLLFLLSEGKHLYLEELNSISDYLKTRRSKLEGIPDFPHLYPKNIPINSTFPKLAHGHSLHKKLRQKKIPVPEV